MTALIGKYLYFDGSKAKRDLGFEPGPAAPAIKRCIEWFRAQETIQDAGKAQEAQWN
jgi:hypothetical protein